MSARFAKSLLLVSLLLPLAILNTSCGKEAVQGGFSSPSLGDDDDDTVTPGKTTGFYVQVAELDWPMTTFLHKFYDRSSTCMVPTTSTGAAAEISCILNVREADLFYSDLKWEFNAPPGMCAWIHETPYYYYNNRAGVGPSTINVTVNAATPPAISSCTIDGVSTTPSANGTCSTTEVSVDATGEATCAYDYSTIGMGNCCSGNYTKNLTTQGTGTVTSKASWGGAPGNCMNGVYKRNGWELSPGNGIPKTIVNRGSSGVNREFSAPKALGIVSHASNITVANFYGWTQYAAGNHSLATVPQGLTASNDLSGSPIASPNPAYLYECVNESDDVIASIKLYVNEWNTNAEFTSYMGGSNTARPDVSGVEGVGCNSDGVPGGYCDDFGTWNSTTPYPDLITNFPRWDN